MIPDRILIIDDQPEVRQKLDKWITHAGFGTEHAGNAAEALALVETVNFSVILLDLVLPDMDGYDLLKKLHADYPDICIIVFTGKGNSNTPELARQNGAFDFFSKPIDFNILDQKLTLAIEYYRRERETYYQMQEARENYQFSNIIGKSAGLLKVFEQIEALADTDESVLILGETGTGKELIANALHTHSSRDQKPLIVVNCGAIPENLAESELFGHEKGAFTGAQSRKIGKFERAHQSSIFLDEIGELNGIIQTKFLRVLQEKTFERIGGKEQLKTDVRIIAATNRDLRKAIDEKQFRKDLFHRLERFVIKIPPLRERTEDIPLLVEHVIKKYNGIYGKSIQNIDGDCLKKLMNYSFPGNVRELENIIINAMLFEKSESLHIDGIHEKIYEAAQDGNDMDFQGKTFREARFTFERNYFAHIVELAGGNISKGSRLAQMDRGHFRDKLKDLGLYHNGHDGNT
ncbi:MAG: sigma-54-dependent Fis family transcriptional regulator [Calditrichaeota bacterium]|nr:MAG: sigma-54-dependent Fis family transcriptional regulator [Calditrichota bacterium]